MSRSDKLLARVDAHLDALPFGSARAKFLASQIDYWEGAYRRWATGHSDDDVYASDYMLAITGLQARLEEARRG